MDDLPSLRITTGDGVARIAISPREEILKIPGAEVHSELGKAFSRLRDDDQIRVILLTGAEDGIFEVPASLSVYDSDVGRNLHNDPARTWKVFSGIIRCLETMVSMEKPIVARVNGDAIGFGQSLMFASDVIIARKDARIGDMHMAMGEMEPFGPGYGIVPGDGGASLVPLFLTPALAKEYLMLGREFTAEELEQRGVINYAVDPEALDERAEEIVAKLLSRSAYALAWTKRVANRHVVAQLNATLDASSAYEMVNLYQIRSSNFVDRLTLE